MTTVIDERVVEMRFNNADFEKNVAQSMSTLDSLKKSLNFDSAKSLEELGKASKGFSLSGITETITEATSKFSVLEIAGVTAIAKITSAAMDMGASLVKSLSIDQVSAGFDKYSQKTTAVQTIIAATHKSILEVESEMNKLNWFTDETSYNFVDMVNNIGKFTSNGVKLEAASGAMQGIATWAARSGQNAQAASRAMYNFSQALGSGAMMVKDWMSIEQANMATTEFKQTAIETAVELGKLKKSADGLYTTLDGKTTVSVNEFRDSLKKKWFDTDAMITTLNKYNQYAEELYALSEKTGRTASQLMIDADKYKEGTLDIESVAKSSKMSVTELAAAYESLNSETNKLSREAFKNAQEAKTFQEVMDATADAVSTSWMNTFQLIFGNYEEAKALWSGMANMLVDAFTQGGTARNEVLSFWREGDIDGRVKLLEAAVNVLNAFIAPLKAIKEAFVSILPGTEQMGKRLKILTMNFADFTKKLIPSEKVLGNLYLTFQGLFNAGKAVVSVFIAIVKAIIPAARPLGSLLEMFTTFTAYIGAFITTVVEYAEEVGVFKTITEVLSGVFGKLLSIIKTVAGVVAGGAVLGIQKLINAFFKLASATDKFIKNSKTIQSVLGKIRKGFDSLKKIISGTEEPIEKVNKVVYKAEEYFAQASKSGVQFGTVTKGVGTASNQALTPLQKLVNIVKLVATVIGAAGLAIGKGILIVFTNFTKFFDGIRNRFAEANKDSTTFFDYFKSIFVVIGELLKEAAGKIKEFFDNLGIDTSGIKSAFDTIGGALSNLMANITVGKILAIALSVALLSLVGAAIDVASKFKEMAGAISGVFTSINKILKKQFAKSTMITDLAKSFAMIAGSLALLTMVDQDKLKSASGIMLGFTAVFMLFAGAVAAVSKVFDQNKFRKNFNTLSRSILMLASSMTVLALALAIISKIQVDNPNDMWAKVEMAALLLGGVVAAAIALSRFSKDMPKGSVLLLALAFSMKQLVSALVEFTSIPYDDIDKHWTGFIAMFAGLAGVIAAAGRIKFGSALGILLLAAALKMILPAFKEIIEAVNQLPLTTMLDSLLKKLNGWLPFIAATVGFIGLVVAYSSRMKAQAKPSIGNVFSGLGGTIAGIGLGVLLIVKAIENIGNTIKGLSSDQWKATITTVFEIILAISAFFAAIAAINTFDTSNTLDKDFKSMAVAMLGIGAAMILISKAIDIIANTNIDGLPAASISIIGVGSLLAAILYVAKDVKKAIPAIGVMIGACTAIALLIGELAILSLIMDSNSGIWDSITVLAGMMLGLWALIREMSRLKDVKTGPIASLAVAIGLIGAALVALSLLPDMNKLIISAITLGTVMTVLTLVFERMSKMSSSALSATTVGLALATLLVVAVSLTKLSQMPWEQIAIAGVALSTTMIAIAAALSILSKIDVAGTVASAGAIVAISGAMVIVAGAMLMMQDIDWGTFGMFAASIGVIAGVLGILAGITAAFPLFGVALLAVGASMIMASAAFLIIAVAFNVFAAALPKLADGINLLIPALTNLANVPFVKLAGELLLFGGTAVVLALLTPAMLTASVGITVFGAAVLLLGGMLEIGAKGLELFSKAMNIAATEVSNAINTMKETIAGLFPDLVSAFTGPGVSSVVLAAATVGKKIAGDKSTGSGFLGAFASVLKWHSPPGFIATFFADLSTAFGNNSNAVSAAEKSGAQVGDGFGKSLMNTLSSWLSKAGSVMSGATAGMSSAVSDSSDSMANSFSRAGAQAEKFGKQVDDTSKKTGFFAKLQETLNNGLESGKEQFGNLANSADYMGDAVENLTENLGLGTEAAGGFGDALEGAGGKAGKAGKDLKDFASTLKDTITNQLDIFNKFEIKQGISAQTMLDNMKSNIDGFASWSHRLAVLAERGIDQALYQKLAEMGPKGYETVAAFVQMTDEQLQEANKLFATSMSLPESQASIVQAGFTYAGEMAAKGFSTALDDHKQAHAAAQGLAKAAIEGIDETLQIHSPSRVMWDKGWYAQMGFREGLRSGQPITIAIIENLCNEIVETFSTCLSQDKFEELSNATITNLFASMLETGEEAENPIVQGLITGLLTFETIDAALTTFVEHVKTMINTLFEVGDAGQSMWFYNFALMGIIQSMINALVVNEVFLLIQILTLGTDIMNTLRGPFGEEGKTLPQIAYDVGMNIALGLRDGINDYAEEAIAAARAMAEAVIAILESIPEINSPSKVTRKLGGYISLGYAIGIEDGADNVYRAAQKVANNAIDGISTGRIQDALNSEFDFNPIITPILDLSYVREQLDELSDMMAIPVNTTVGQNEGNSTKDTPSQINFTQNNYSPKSLSRYEIYRQTKNQISQLKGVMA